MGKLNWKEQISASGPKWWSAEYGTDNEDHEFARHENGTAIVTIRRWDPVALKWHRASFTFTADPGADIDAKLMAVADHLRGQLDALKALVQP